MAPAGPPGTSARLRAWRGEVVQAEPLLPSFPYAIKHGVRVPEVLAARVGALRDHAAHPCCLGGGQADAAVLDDHATRGVDAQLLRVAEVGG